MTVNILLWIKNKKKTTKKTHNQEWAAWVEKLIPDSFLFKIHMIKSTQKVVTDICVFWFNHNFFPYCCVVFSHNIAFFVVFSWKKKEKTVYKRMNINMANLTMGIAYEETFPFTVCKRTKVAGKQDTSLYPYFQQQCPICVNRHRVFGIWNPQVTMAM